jgi:hypothetical protein
MLRRKDLLKIVAVAIPALAILSCQKMERPALGDYPQDHQTTPTTPLRFFLKFRFNGGGGPTDQYPFSKTAFRDTRVFSRLHPSLTPAELTERPMTDRRRLLKLC